jgi:hypothetical protein
MNVTKFTETFDRAVARTDTLARRAGYGEVVTDAHKLDVAQAWQQAVAEFEVLAREVATAIARASVFMPEAGTMAERVDIIKKAIEKANAEDMKRARAEADRAWRNS